MGGQFSSSLSKAKVHANAIAAIIDNAIVFPFGGIFSSEFSDIIATMLTPRTIASTAKICNLDIGVPIQIAHEIESIG